MLNPVDLQKTVAVLGAMTQYELDLANLYKICADTWKSDAALWQSLSHAEIGHADNIKKITEILVKKSHAFEIGRPLNIIALNTATAGIKANMKRISDGEMTLEKMLVLARDIEQSILEARYAEIVKTADIEYQTLMSSIISQTHEHRNIIQKKLDGIRKGT